MDKGLLGFIGLLSILVYCTHAIVFEFFSLAARIALSLLRLPALISIFLIFVTACQKQGIQKISLTPTQFRGRVLFLFAWYLMNGQA